MTKITLTEAQLRKMGIDPAPTMPQDAPRSPRKHAKAGMRLPSHPTLAGPVVVGVFGAHIHRWQWCKAWEQFISVCGIGKAGSPGSGEGAECVRCFSEQEEAQQNG